VPYALGRLLR